MITLRYNMNDGEWQMKLCSLPHHSPPVVWPSSQEPLEQYKSVVQWLGIPDLESLKLLRRTMVYLFYCWEPRLLTTAFTEPRAFPSFFNFNFFKLKDNCFI